MTGTAGPRQPDPGVPEVISQAALPGEPAEDDHAGSPAVDGAPGAFGLRLEWPSDGLSVDRPSTHETPPAGGAGNSPPVVDGGVPSPPVPLLPAMAGRIESVHGALVTMSVRLDGLAATTNGLRAALGDQLIDHGETVARLSRAQATSLEEYRQGTAQMAGDLRRTAQDTEESLRRVAARVDDLTAEIGSLAASVQTASNESRDLVSISEKLTHQLTEGIDAFGEQVLARLDEIEQSSSAAAEASHGQLAAGAARTTRQVAASLDALADRLVERIGELGESEDATAAAVDATRADVALLRRELGTSRSTRRTTPAADADVVTALDGLRDEVQQLKRRLGVRAKAPTGGLSNDQLIRLADLVAERVGTSGTPSIGARQLDAIARAVVARMEDVFELVDEGH